jgi:formate dehydrogenase iron-sulfur subunit
LVGLWKGFVKPLSLFGIAIAALAGFFHWVLEGPNEVQPEDEIKARELAKAAERPS